MIIIKVLPSALPRIVSQRMLLMRGWLIWGIVVSVMVGFRVECIVLLVIVAWFQWIGMLIVLVVSEGIVYVLYRIL